MKRGLVRVRGMIMEKKIMRLLCVFPFAATMYWPLTQHADAGHIIRQRQETDVIQKQ